MSKRRMKNEALLAPFLVTPIAHRGLHDEKYDENSMPAFQSAIDHKYAIELDVHLSKDGQLVVVHDEDLARVTGQAGLVEQMNWADIQKYRLLVCQQPLPLLNDVLKLINGRVPLLIELKVKHNREPLADAVIEALYKYKVKTMIAIQSFDPLIMKYLGKTYPKQFAYGQLASRDVGEQPAHVKWLFKSMMINKISNPNFTAYDIRYLPQKRIAAIRKQMPVLTWTVDSPEKLAVANQNADNVIFEGINPHQ